jgi:hypothetical protein
MRGATAIEYAFLVALFTIPLVEVVEIVQDEQGEHIAESGNRAGTPAEYSSGVPPVPPPTTLDDGSNGSGNTNIETFASLTISGKRQGPKWTATAEIAASDVNGSVSGGVFEGTWEIYDLDGTLDRTVAASCTIDTKGDCTLSLASLNFGTADKDHSATFIITGLVSEDLVPAAGVIGSTITIVKTDI